MLQGPPLKIAMLAAEASPYAKVGGLGDVMGALPKALAKLGADPVVIIPKYRITESGGFDLRRCPQVPGFDVPMGSSLERADVFETTMNRTPVKVYLLGSRRYFNRNGIYDDPATGEGYPDNMERFIFFMKAGLELLLRLECPVDIIHCHDSHTALIPGLIHTNYHDEPFFSQTGTLFTIHNIAYQGIYPKEALYYAGIDLRHFYPLSPFEYWGQVNFMKVGIEFADKINTVSRTYAMEIQTSSEYGFGLEGILRNRRDDLTGIINGIDYDEWNPETDALIPARFSARDLAGKRECKKHLRQRFGLLNADDDIPLIGVVSRLTEQKGLDLLEQALEQLLSLDLQLIVLGVGQHKYQEFFRQVVTRYPEKVAVHLSFDNELAHQIEAGCDMFLMPSKYEPCGLNQLYSLRYGTIPIVRATGGLADTVVPYEDGKGTGFCFTEYSASAMIDAIRRAISVYRNTELWRELMIRAMGQDWSWNRSAREYLELYKSIYVKRHA